MPLHLDSITPNSQDSSIIACILQKWINECDAVFATEDKKYIHMRKRITDILTNENIGQMIYTVFHNEVEKRLEILDLDIIMDSDATSKIRFLKLREGSSDSNEYYDVEAVAEGQHLEIETVNRHTEPRDLVDTEREVHVSMFPFQLTVYESIDDLNQQFGFSKPVEAGKSGLFVHGYSERFAMPGGLMNENKKADDSYSFVIGKVKSFRDVAIEFGESNLPFVLAKVDTALGVVPVVMGRDVFELSKLRNNCIIAMNTVVKVDIATANAY